jgi:hypothetical protein
MEPKPVYHTARPAYPLDPGLQLETATLRALAQTMGAAEIAILRALERPTLTWTRGGLPDTFATANAGTLVLIRFTAHDDGQPCEHWTSESQPTTAG